MGKSMADRPGVPLLCKERRRAGSFFEVLNGCYPHGLSMGPRLYLTLPLLTKERYPERIQFERGSADWELPTKKPEAQNV